MVFNLLKLGSNPQKNIFNYLLHAKGFPYQYFPGEFLSENHVKYRLRLIYIYLMFGICTWGPSLGVILPTRPPTYLFSSSSIEQIQEIEPSSQFKNFLKVAPTFMENSDKIVLTDKQIKQFDRIGHQVICGSMTIDEAILEIRGGSVVDMAAILAFVIFVNWLDSLYGIESFQNVPLPHMDPVGWLSGKYHHAKYPNNGRSKFPFEQKLIESKNMCYASASSEQENDNPVLPPTKKITQNFIKENNYDRTTQTFHPRDFCDWEGHPLVNKSREIKFGTFSHAYEAGVSTKNDLVKCSTEGYLRKNCSLITDETVNNFSNKMQSLAQSTSPDMVKFTLPMVYYDSQPAIYYLDTITGDAAIYHENGKYWGYKLYTDDDISDALSKADKLGTLKRPPSK